MAGQHPQQMVDVAMWFNMLERGDLACTREPLCAFRCHPLQQTERNAASGLGPEEHADFLSDYATQPWLPRQAVLPVLFDLRRTRRKRPGPSARRALERQRPPAARRGRGWRWLYGLYFIYYRITKPFRNLRHSVEKRLFRLQAARLAWPASAEFS